MDPAVVREEPLPDGRRLVVYADGHEVVVGRAEPRPHPVAGWEWLGPHPARPTPPRVRPRTETGTRARTAAPTPPRRARVTPAAERRARELLESLLTDVQRADFWRSGGFWVPTPRGPVRLGELYRLVHRPIDRPGVEDVLCVVPRVYGDLPRADIWTNLLLTLAVEPERFFSVAVRQGTRRRQP